jgi:antitoxin ParD1/3/4
MPVPAKKISITLPLEMADMLQAKVQSGSYGSVSEVIRAALRTMMEQERLLHRLDGSIARGLADGEAGRVRSVSEARAQLRDRLERATPVRTE